MAETSNVAQNLLSVLAGGLVSGVFAVHTSNQNAQLDRDKLDLQRQLEQQKGQQATAEEFRKRQDTTNRDTSARQQTHRRDVKSAAADLNGKYWTVLVKAHCEQSVQMAWTYEALDGLRVVEGWFTVLPGTPTETIKTTSPQTFYYARTGMGRGTKEITIKDTREFFPWKMIPSFLYLDAYMTQDAPTIPFQGWLISARTWGSTVLELNCDDFVVRKP